MKKTRVLVGMFVILALAGAAAVAYVERYPVLGWYQTLSDKVVATVKGARTAKGVKGLYYCPMHPAFTSLRFAF